MPIIVKEIGVIKEKLCTQHCNSKNDSIGGESRPLKDPVYRNGNSFKRKESKLRLVQQLAMGVLSQVRHRRHQEDSTTLVSKAQDLSQAVNRTQHYHGQYVSFALLQDTRVSGSWRLVSKF